MAKPKEMTKIVDNAPSKTDAISTEHLLYEVSIPSRIEEINGEWFVFVCPDNMIAAVEIIRAAFSEDSEDR